MPFQIESSKSICLVDIPIEIRIYQLELTKTINYTDHTRGKNEVKQYS